MAFGYTLHDLSACSFTVGQQGHNVKNNTGPKTLCTTAETISLISVQCLRTCGCAESAQRTYTLRAVALGFYSPASLPWQFAFLDLTLGSHYCSSFSLACHYYSGYPSYVSKAKSMFYTSYSWFSYWPYEFCRINTSVFVVCYANYFHKNSGFEKKCVRVVSKYNSVLIITPVGMQCPEIRRKILPKDPCVIIYVYLRKAIKLKVYFDKRNCRLWIRPYNQCCYRTLQ